MQSKCQAWAKEMNIVDFKCSNGWLNSTLKRLKFTKINLDGEAYDMLDDDVQKVMTPWKKELKDLIEDKNITPKRVHKRIQNQLFITLLNITRRIYCSIEM